MSVLTDSNNINFEVRHRVLSQSVYALLSLIQAMLNMSTLSMNDQGESFWELVYGSVNQVLADHHPAVLYHFFQMFQIINFPAVDQSLQRSQME